MGRFFFHRRCRAGVWGAACASLLALLGCGKAAGPEFVPVRGRVTLNGQPLGMGTIHFVPDESRGTSGPMSTGVIGADGSFSLRGPGMHVGAMVGDHQVHVTMPLPDFTPTPVLIDGKVVVEDPPRGDAASAVPQVPKRYLQPDTSGWTASVVVGGANEFDFEITK